jgi:2,5-furandicarboxylate decarboxylase 1
MKKNKDLRDFLKLVKGAGPEYYLETNKPVDPDLQVQILQEKLAVQGRFPVIKCNKIQGSNIPLITNLFGSYEMLAMAFGLEPQRSSMDLTEQEYFPFSDRGIPKVDRVKLGNIVREKLAKKCPAEVVSASEAPVKEVVLKGDKIDLGILPITRHGALDSSKYLTVACTISKDPDSGIPNVGIYREEIKSKNQIGIGTHPGHHFGYIARRCAELGKPMEVAITLGHHPAVVLGAETKGALELNEFEMMGGLLGEPLLVTPAETIDLHVPAWAEIVIEGVIDASKPVIDGPFAEYTGYYGERGGRTVYVLNITAITMRKDAIFHDLDSAHREHNLLTALFNEAIVYEMVKKVIPTLKAVNMPISGTCAHHVYLSIKKRIQGEGKLAAMTALVADHNSKMAVVVDDDVDVYDEQQVLWAIATRATAHKDMSIVPGVAASELDPTSYDETGLKRGHMNTMIIVDATRPVGSEYAIRIAPREDLWKSTKLNDYFRLT